MTLACRVKELERCVAELKANPPPTNQQILDLVQGALATASAQEDDCWVQVQISDGAAPTVTADNGLHAGSIAVSGGTGANGAGRIYTLSWPTAHPLGAGYHANVIPRDDTQPDTATPEILSQTPTSITYQLPQGDDGGSEDDNDFYAHDVKVFGTNQTFITQLLFNGDPI